MLHHTNAPDSDAARYRQERVSHWDEIARSVGRRRRRWADTYHREIIGEFRHLVSPGKRMLELGSGCGDVLAALSPSSGVGVDFSSEMVALARQRHPELQFVTADASSCTSEVHGTFDVIILSDLVNDVYDAQALFEHVHRWCHPGTRLIINFHSQLWRPVLSLARTVGLASPQLPQNWFTSADISHLLSLTDFEAIRAWQAILCPAWFPLGGRLLNRYVGRVWPFRHLCLTNFILARPGPARSVRAVSPTVSVVVPARNEAGNISGILDRVPRMGAGTEIVFVEGGSSDDTYKTIAAEIRRRHLEESCRVFRQEGKGKGDAVRLGFSRASGDILMILDADMTVPPEILPRFCEALRSGRAEFANGVRLVYPMEEQAMRFLNLIGNKAFSMAFSWLLGQPVKDTLCGTKALWRSDYEAIAANRSTFGSFDPFGDFDLIFGAVKQNLRIVDIPVRYRQRTYGTTNISRWRHGLLLVRMVLFAARRIKFV